MMRLVASVALVAGLALSPALAQTADPKDTIRMETTKGTVTFVLRPDIAPKHAERIKLLAREGFYNNAPFHRVIAGFMAQTGDGQRGDGTGKSKYPDLPAEFSKVPFKRGVLGMARSQNPNLANSQFFIMFADAAHLNGTYTVVGEVTAGMDVVDKLNKGPAANNGAVPNPDRIVKMQAAGQ